VNKKYIVGIGIIILVIVLAFAVWKVVRHVNQNSFVASSNTQIQPLPKEVTINLDKNGFSPNQVTIKVGTAVRWKNESGAQETVNSDSYPTNQLHKELNFGVFNNGSSVVYTFTKPGTYGYHNQFHHEQVGKVIVE